MAELGTQLRDPQEFQRPVGVENVNRNDLFSAGAGFLQNLRKGAGNGPSLTEERNLIEDNALDELARGTRNILNGLGPDGQSLLEEGEQLQKAMEDGAIDRTVYDVRLNSLVNTVSAKYPEAESEIFTYLAERGLDHYVFRHAKAMQAQADNVLKDTLARQTLYRETAAKAGAITAGMTDLEIQRKGAGILARDKILADAVVLRNLQVQDAELDAKLAEADRLAAKEGWDREGDHLTSTLLARVAEPLGAMVDTMYSLSNTAGQDTEMNKALSEQVNMFKQEAELGRAQMKTMAAQLRLNPTQIEHLDRQFSQFITDMDQLFSDPTSFAQTNARNLKVLADTQLLDNQDLFPVYRKMVEGLGQEVTNALLNGTLTGFSPGDVQFIRDEMVRGMRSLQLDAEATNKLFQETKDTLNGTVIPQFKTEAERKRALQTKVIGLNATQPVMLSGDADKNSQRIWANSSIGVLGVGESIESPTLKSKNVDSLLATVFDGKWLSAWDAYEASGVDPDNARAMAQYSGIVAAKTLDSLKNQYAVPDAGTRKMRGLIQPSQGGPLIVYDDLTGRFTATLPEPSKAGGSFQGQSLSNAVAAGRAVTPEIKKAVSQMNAILDHMEAINERVPIVPDGVMSPPSETELEGAAGTTPDLTVRDIFGSTDNLYGAMEKWIDANAAKSVIDPSSRELFYATIDKIKAVNGNSFDFSGIERSQRYMDEIQRVGATKMSYAPVNNIDGYLDRTAMWESGGNPGAKNPLSSASGMFQFIDETWLEHINAIEDFRGLDDATKLALKNDPVIARQVAELFTMNNADQLRSELGHAPSWDELYLAHHFGVGGALSFIKANPNQKARQLVSKGVIDANPRVFKGDPTVRQMMDRILHKNDPRWEDYMEDRYGSTDVAFVPSQDFISDIDDGDL